MSSDTPNQLSPTVSLLAQIAASLARLVAIAEKQARPAATRPAGASSAAPPTEVPCARRPGGNRPVEITSKYAGQCRECGADHAPGDRVILTPGQKGVRCLSCWRANRGAA